MTRKELAEWLDQMETSLVRAEEAKKDIDLILLLRMAHKRLKELLKEAEEDGE